jgi:hypothetical protein
MISIVVIVGSVRKEVEETLAPGGIGECVHEHKEDAACFVIGNNVEEAEEMEIQMKIP